jgi:hypothetical protein
MATQASRRRDALVALRSFKNQYRKADTLGETVQRELDRLIKRKTLIGPDSLANLAKYLDSYSRQTSLLQSAYASLWQVIRNIPV